MMATFSTGTGTEQFDGHGSLTPTPRYDKDELQALFEYGVTDNLTAILNPSLQHVDIDAPTSAARTGLGYTELGGRYKLVQTEDWVFSGQATMRIPGTFETSNPAAIGYNEVESDFRALAGHNFTLAGMPAFTDLEIAQRFRTAGAPDEFRADGTFGLYVAPQWLILAQSFNVLSEGSGTDTLYGGSYEYYKAQLSAVYKVSLQWSLQAGAFTTYAGRNALQENGVILGVWRQF